MLARKYKGLVSIHFVTIYITNHVKWTIYQLFDPASQDARMNLIIQGTEVQITKDRFVFLENSDIVQDLVDGNLENWKVLV